jgi:hypothetical protein
MNRTLLFAFALVYSVGHLAAQEPAATPAPQATNRILIVVEKDKELEADHYLWAAEMAAGRLKGDTKEVIPGGLAAGLKEAREKPGTVRGIIDIVINVYSWDEDVRIACYDATGHELWKKKSSMNSGGSEEDLARKLFERTLKKAEEMPACGRAK